MGVLGGVGVLGGENWLYSIEVVSGLLLRRLEDARLVIEELLLASFRGY